MTTLHPYSNRSELLPGDAQTCPLWFISQPGGHKVCTEQLHRMGQVAHYAIDELGLSGGPRIQAARDIASDKLVVQAGDILVSRLNPSRGHVFEVERHTVTAVASTEFAVVRPRPSHDPRFVRYALESVPIRQHLDSHVRSSTRSHGRVEFPYLWNQHLPYWTLQVQRQIADYLEVVTADIARLSATIDSARTLLNERRTAAVATVLDVAATTRPLRYCLRSFIGGDWGSESGEDDVDVRVYRAADFDRRRHLLVHDRAPRRSIGNRSLRSRRLLDGDLVIEKSGGGDKQPVGCVARYAARGDDVPSIPSNFNARMVPASDVDSEYLNFVFAALYETRVSRPYANQTTGIQNLELNAYLDRPVPVPGIETQRRIVSEIRAQWDRMDRATTAIERMNELLRERRQAVITAAVTGELEV